MKCDHCGGEVRRVESGLQVGAARHDNDESNLHAQFCETANGFVRVTVDGQKTLPR